MNWLLAVGIILVAVPIVGFVFAGCFMLYASIKDDAEGGKVMLGLVAAIVLGGVFLAAYAGLQAIS